MFPWLENEWSTLNILLVSAFVSFPLCGSTFSSNSFYLYLFEMSINESSFILSRGYTRSHTHIECQAVIERAEPGLLESIIRTERTWVETLILNIPLFRVQLSSDLLGFTSTIWEFCLIVSSVMLVQGSLENKTVLLWQDLDRTRWCMFVLPADMSGWMICQTPLLLTG